MRLLIIYFIFSILTGTMSSGQTVTNDQYSHPLYMPEQVLGELFTDVQMAGIFKDSKTFVDCIPVINPDTILALYKAEKLKPGFILKDFVSQYFKQPEPVISSFRDGIKQDIILHLQKHWPKLVRQSNSNEIYNSLINLPYPFVVPGGRFREMFYWDSYFTIIGLLESGDDELALGMIKNFEYLVNTFGHIPNGNRTYFLSRSQPPFFAEMLKVYGDKHGMKSIIQFLPALQKEYDYWTQDNKQVNEQNTVSGKAVGLNGTILNRYTGTLVTPRPEAYNKEFTWAQALPEKDRPQFYQNLRAACESGWDFSSRWFADGKNKTTVQCESMIPICLNSLLYNCEMQLSVMYVFQKNIDSAKYFEKLAASRKAGINKYCWSQKDNVFTDYQFVKHQLNPVISLATVYPLFFGLATQQQADNIAKIIEEKFLVKGGVVTTLISSGEQWDAPNGWAPLQWLTVAGLSRYGHNYLAKKIATRWLGVNESIYISEHKMMEKYNVINPQIPGGGGNYENQDGFGWTNGVALALNEWLKKLNK